MQFTYNIYQVIPAVDNGNPLPVPAPIPQLLFPIFPGDLVTVTLGAVIFNQNDPFPALEVDFLISPPTYFAPGSLATYDHLIANSSNPGPLTATFYFAPDPNPQQNPSDILSGSSIVTDHKTYDIESLILPSSLPVVVQWSGAYAYAAIDGPWLARITITVDNPDRTAPPIPPRLTAEQKAEFESQSEALSVLSQTNAAFAGATDPLHPALLLVNRLTSSAVGAIAPQVGLANSGIQFAVNTVSSALQEAPTSPVSLVFSIAGTSDLIASLLLKALANDPIDGNFKTVYQAPGWTFGTIAGVSATANTYLADSWKLLQYSANALTASERYQGAQLIGDTASAALQNNAFNTALDAYEAARLLVSADLKAFIAEMQSSLSDVNLATDPSYVDVQNYAKGLANPLSDDPYLAGLISSLTTATPYLTGVINSALQQSLTAFENSSSPSLTGSAFAKMSQVADQLVAPPPANVSQTLAEYASNHAITGLAVVDTSSNLVAGLDGLQAAISAITSVTLADSTTPTVSIVGSQYLADSQIIEKISSAFNLHINLDAGANAIAAPTNSPHNGAGGHDVILGDGLHDQVTFAVPSTSFTLAKDNSGGVTLSGGSDQTSYQLDHIEFLTFTDKTVFVENTDNANIARLYAAALDRAPDTVGLSGWEDIYATKVAASAKAQGIYVALAQADLGGGISIAGGFTHSTEFMNKYGALDDAGFITLLYNNVLDRNPAASEVAAWVNGMHQDGLSREWVLVGFAESQENINKAAADWLISI